MRSPRRFIEDVEAGKYSKPSKDAAYLTGEGLLSMKSDECKGCNTLFNFKALLKSSLHAV